MIISMRRTVFSLITIVGLLTAMLAISLPSASAANETLASVFNGNSATYIVPSGVTRIQVIAAGGHGGDGGGPEGGIGGTGGAVIARFDVETGDQILIQSSTNGEDGADGGSGGIGGSAGGNGGMTEVSAGGGGGASTVTINGVLVVVAAGGGGGGYSFEDEGGNGGWADNEIGGSGGNGDGEAIAGGGASEGNGGAAGDIGAYPGNNFDDDPAGEGGAGSSAEFESGGGGGGGYAGGGGGGSDATGGGAGGGAGSSFAHQSAENVSMYVNMLGEERASGNAVLLINQSPEPEDDGDGADETGLPNDGDANGDGTQDSDQTNVISFENPETSSYTSIAASSGCFTEGSMTKEVSLTQQDGSFEYPAGLATFTIGCLDDGDTVTVQLFFYGTSKKAADFVPRKFTAYNGVYQTLAGAAVEDVTIGGQAVVKVTYSLVDGGQLDNDQEANGEIVDPAGLALVSVSGSLPATGPQSVLPQLFTAIILVGSGSILNRIRRRHVFQK